MVSREITELLNKDVQLQSSPPRYYYTKLADLKIEMISQATADARIRAKKLPKTVVVNLEILKVLLWVFFKSLVRIAAKTTAGAVLLILRTKKTASITMRLEYEID